MQLQGRPWTSRLGVSVTMNYTRRMQGEGRRLTDFQFLQPAVLNSSKWWQLLDSLLSKCCTLSYFDLDIWQLLVSMCRQNAFFQCKTNHHTGTLGSWTQDIDFSTLHTVEPTGIIEKQLFTALDRQTLANGTLYFTHLLICPLLWLCIGCLSPCTSNRCQTNPNQDKMKEYCCSKKQTTKKE